ncbi:hypothetical protein I317_07509 [Kwoniella heveanensis CBS 569]|nr:hypothetical protein I317_07509 [Kwoniella heveanensis CBS 569]
MSSRTRGKRAVAAAAPAYHEEPIAEASTSGSRSRASRNRRASKPGPEVEEYDDHQDEEVDVDVNNEQADAVEENQTLRDEEALALGEAEDDVEGEDIDEDFEESTPGRARGGGRRRGRGRGRGRGGARGGRGGARGRRKSMGRGRPAAPAQDDEDDALGETDAEGEVEEEGDDEEVKPVTGRRGRKSVSYREIPVEASEAEGDDDAEEDEEEDAEGEPDDDAEDLQPRRRQPPVRLSSQTSNTTPRRRSRPSLKSTAAAESDEDKDDTPYKKEKIPGGSGRGGFSVKGAAAAAARARWDKVRREKIERGEDPDEPRSARKPKPRRVVVPEADHLEVDSMMTIKGVEYKVGDDEVVLPDDPKGDTKVDAEGRLQGGREYKLVTFASAGRRNPEKLYAMTIDAARACGFTDSLAFLRRYPQILKLSCSPDERELLMNMGRIAGNLKHRQVTMVSVRNVYKLLGAKIIKDGKWVTDDYYEDEAIAKCQEKGIEPGTIFEEEEIIPQHTIQTTSMSTRQRGEAYDPSRPSHSNLHPFYMLGGPTTTFAGSGVNPWTEAGYGNKRHKLRAGGADEENWLFKLAEEARAIDQRLRGYREERLEELDGADAKGWVYVLEKQTEELPADTVAVIGGGRGGGGGSPDQVDSGAGGIASSSRLQSSTLPPPLDRKRSALSQDVTREMTQLSGTEEPITPLPTDFDNDESVVENGGDISMESADQVEGRDGDSPSAKKRKKEGPEIVVENVGAVSSRYNWGLGSWQRGSVKAAYEPHTQMPHVPLSTQPSSSKWSRYSPYPLVGVGLLSFEPATTASNGDSVPTQRQPHRPSASSGTATGQRILGLASVEYVLGTTPESESDSGSGPLSTSVTPQEHETEHERRMKEVESALQWEKESKKRRIAARATATATSRRASTAAPPFADGVAV